MAGKINIIDLFSGCGGLSDGFEQTGKYRTLACVDWEKPTCDTLIKRLHDKWGYKNAAETVLHYDIQQTDRLIEGWEDGEGYSAGSGLDNIISGSGERVDVIIGGPPCQAYSVAGRIRDENGMNDDYRNYLFESYLKVVDRYKPKLFVFENVPGLLSATPGDVSIVDRITESFRNIGYEITSDLRKNAIVDCSEYGIPQSRKRVVIIGINRNSTKADAQGVLSDFYNNILPKYKTAKKSVADAIGDLPKLYPLSGSTDINRKKCSHESVSVNGINNHTPRMHSVRDIEIFRTLAMDIQSGENKYETTRSLKRLYYERTGRSSNIHKYHVLRWDKPSNTIPAHLYKDGLRHIHPDPEQARSITVREAARLQSFDDDFIFTGSMTDQYKMIGNAVPPKFAKAVAGAVNELLEKYFDMAQYYVKQLRHQEMGSPDAAGKTHRGRYFYLSKDSGDFFPLLSRTILNDTLVLPIIMPFSDSKIYAKFVYHNSKYFPEASTGDPRNEFRLYLNNALDQNRALFHAGEIVVIEKVMTSSANPADIGYVYSINLFSPRDEHYAYLERIIEDSPMRGKSALVEGDLSFVPRPVINDETGVAISEEILHVVKEEQKDLLSAIEKEVPVSDGGNVEDIRGANLFNSISFRDFVLYAYGYKCAITGKSIRYGDLNNLEAAHIQPRARAGTFLPCNGLALCRDMHWAFDKGFITITDDYTVLVHDEVKATVLSEIDGKRITVPDDPYFQPERKFLRHHRENIFGLFIHSGVIRNN
ncbi:MAG: DNA (cytosine-5-)-methyltransferase [Rikenellaceae bacterium]|jgi:DNA (cytosine-5)-methyltransferase 1|nr:DNA (cytosine-5-)-methyltransferase [Rikenellaceae bacterium]